LKARSGWREPSYRKKVWPVGMADLPHVLAGFSGANLSVTQAESPIGDVP